VEARETAFAQQYAALHARLHLSQQQVHTRRRKMRIQLLKML
jgi:hypothetical protein